MPSSVDGVYYRDNRFIDFFNNPINFNNLNTDTGDGDSGGSSLFGATGPTGATGQDLLFVPGGTGTVERILPNVSIFQLTTAPLVYELYIYPLLPNDNQIIRFSSYQNTKSGAGDLSGCTILFEEISSTGVPTIHTLFTTSPDALNQGLDPAKIKFDKDPNVLPSTPSGYPLLERINFIQSDFELSRVGNNVYIRAKIYGFNPTQQTAYGRSTFVQKSWILNAAYSLNNKCKIEFNTLPAGFGTSLGISNILRYNAY
jgi:hypothetical protein